MQKIKHKEEVESDFRKMFETENIDLSRRQADADRSYYDTPTGKFLISRRLSTVDDVSRGLQMYLYRENTARKLDCAFDMQTARDKDASHTIFWVVER